MFTINVIFATMLHNSISVFSLWSHFISRGELRCKTIHCSVYCLDRWPPKIKCQRIQCHLYYSVENFEFMLILSLPILLIAIEHQRHLHRQREKKVCREKWDRQHKSTHKTWKIRKETKTETNSTHLPNKTDSAFNTHRLFNGRLIWIPPRAHAIEYTYIPFIPIRVAFRTDNVSMVKTKMD